MERNLIAGIAADRNEARITLELGCPTAPAQSRRSSAHWQTPGSSST